MSDADPHQGPPVALPWRPVAAGLAALLVLQQLAVGTAFGPLADVVVGQLSAAAAWFGVVRGRLEPRRAWFAVAGGLWAVTIGDAIAGFGGVSGGPFQVTAADLFWGAGAVGLVVGVLLLSEVSLRPRDPDAALDSLMAVIAIVVVVWGPVLDRRLDSASLGPLARVASVAYPLVGVLVVAVLCRLVLGGRRTVSGLLLLAAALLHLASDAYFGAAVDASGHRVGSEQLITGMAMASYVLVAVAVLHPSARDLGRPAARDRARNSWARLAVSGLALMTPLAATLAAVSDGRRVPTVMVSVSAVALVSLTCIRLGRLAGAADQAQEALAERERYFSALVRNATDAVLVCDARGRITYASPAAVTLLGTRPDDLVGRVGSDLTPARELERARSLIVEATDAPGSVVSGEIQAVRPDGSHTWLELRVTDLLAEPAVNGIVLNVQDVTGRKAAEAELERRAFTDVLTGLANRALFHDRVEHALARRGGAVALLYCDLDGFKEVNDRFGHIEGDRLLRAVAHRLGAAVRPEDTVARLGGDEFAVLVEAADDVAETSQAVAARVLEAVALPFGVGGEQVMVRASVGIAYSGPGIDGADDLLRHADVAMYAAKGRGGGHVVVHSRPVPDPAPDVPALDVT